jgi:putative ABC transport system permease protein
MTKSPGIFALTRRRFATPRSAALVIIALTALAAFVIAAAPRALVGVVRAEVAHQISGVPPTSRDLTGDVRGFTSFGSPRETEVAEGWDAGAADVFGVLGQSLADNRASFEPELLALAAPAEFAIFTDDVLVVPEDLAEDAPFSLVHLLGEPTAQSHLEVVEGSWPAPWTGDGPIEIALSVEAAQVMDWAVGEVRGVPADPGAPLTSPWSPVDPTFVLVATVAATDAEADRWLHLPTALTATVFDDGNRRPQATSVAWVAPASIEQLARPYWTTTLAWYPIDGSGAIQEEPRPLLSAFRGATSGSVPLDPAAQVRMGFESTITEVLSTALARADSASAILAVAAVGPLAVSVALIVLAGTLIIRRRRTDLALMSARGAPIARLRGLLLGEGLLLGMPASVVAAAIGVALTPFDAGLVPTVIAVAVGVVPALALALTLRPATLTRARADLDAPVRSRWRRIVELVVVLLAVLAVVQLVLRGIGPATDGIDPLVVVAPLLATVALALLVVRLHPIPIAAALRAARRGRGVVGLVGAARNLRDPAAGTTAVLAMLVAVAIAVFSSVILATVDRGAVQAAERAVGADIQLAGPFFDDAMIEGMRAVDGVEDAVGVMRGDYLGVAGSYGRDSALVLVADTARLADVQEGMTGGLPAGAITPSVTPVQIIASTALTADLGDITSLSDVDVDTVAVIDRLLGVTASATFVVVDTVDYTALTGRGFFPRNVFVSTSSGADAAAVADELSDIVGAAHSVRLLDESTAEIQASPAVTALRVVLFAALGLAVALSVVAVLLVAGVSQDARSRVIALLRTMGLDRRRGRGIVAWEFAPLGVTALVGGILLGIALPLLVVLSIDLRPFTGGGAQPVLAVDPVLSGILIAVVIAALALAVLAGVVGARTTSMATVLRTEED